ncbi:MAG: RNA polymerase sporulation sigma factor SigK [Thermaerobacter sp.]|nr:RNA polymerase sporulation sigma factor SigK [Thermaerobacter sp.]
MDFDIVALVVLPLLRGVWLLIGYLSGSAFPQPLSEAEEADALKNLKGGDRKARQLLIERNLRLVAHIVKKFENTGEDTDDLISIGTVGLIKGIDTFNLERGTRLATYAARCIENEILMHLRVTKRRRSEVSIYDPIGYDREGNEIMLIDVLGSEPNVIPDQVVAREEVELLHKELRILAPKERKVLELRFGLRHAPRKTQREIARMLGISRSYVSRIEKRAVTKLAREDLR